MTAVPTCEQQAESPPDKDLVVAAQAGEVAAFELLLARHYDRIHAFAWRWCGRKEDAEDVTQNVCMTLADKIGSFRFEAAFTSWLYRLTLNAARDWQRGPGRHAGREVELFEEIEAGSFGNPEQAAESAEMLRQVAALPEKIRAAVLLVHAEGLGHAEAAAALECSEGTVSWRIHEARRLLNEKRAGSKQKEART